MDGIPDWHGLQGKWGRLQKAVDASCTRLGMDNALRAPHLALTITFRERLPLAMI